jgi:hypothetical protein
MQQPRAQAGGISDLLAALQGGGNSPLYDQIAPPQAEAGPVPFADFQYLLNTPASERGYGFVPQTVDGAGDSGMSGQGVDLDPFSFGFPNTENVIYDEPPPSGTIDQVEPPPSGTIDQVLPEGLPVEQDMYVMDPNLGNSPAVNPVAANPVASDPAGTSISLPGGGSFLLTPDMQARIDEMQAKVAANQAAPAANPAMTMSPEELAALRERLGNMNFGGFGGNFNIPTQAVAPEAAPATTLESLMAQIPNNSFMGRAFDREALMARIKAMQAQNAVNPVKMDGPRTISGGGSTVKTGAPRPMMMGRNPMFRGGR